MSDDDPSPELQQALDSNVKWILEVLATMREAIREGLTRQRFDRLGNGGSPTLN